MRLEIPAIAFFPCTEADLQDEGGSEAFTKRISSAQVVLITDVALDSSSGRLLKNYNLVDDSHTAVYVSG